jgi:hypothetical protein
VATRAKERLRLASKAVLPEVLIEKVRQRRERMNLGSEKAT